MLQEVSDRLELAAWLRERCAEYRFDVRGVFRQRGRDDWPLAATDASDLELQLSARGHLLPLPKEPAALANVIEVSIVEFLIEEAKAVDRLEVRRGTERGYPDLEFSGDPLQGGYQAVDVKVARRATGSGLRTESRITLYTGNTYFKFPDLHWPGTFRPFNDYATHVDVIAIYTLNTEVGWRVEGLELIVQEPWRIASKQRSSTTREYLGAVDLISDLREGRGQFDSPEAFYKYWRAFPFRLSAQVQKQLDRLVRQQRTELDALRKQHPAP